MALLPLGYWSPLRRSPTSWPTRPATLKSQSFISGGESVLLSSGIHSFPFKLGLPLGLPSTFLGKHGWVQYFCKAALREENGLTHKNQQERIPPTPSMSLRSLSSQLFPLGQICNCDIEGPLSHAGLHNNESHRSQPGATYSGGKYKYTRRLGVSDHSFTLQPFFHLAELNARAAEKLGYYECPALANFIAAISDSRRR